MTTILDALQKGTGYLEKHGVDGARTTMQHLLAHVLRCDRMKLYVDFDRPLGEEQLEQIRELMRQRANGRPLQHLLGTVEFHGHEFECDERALIPRPETEQLVDRLVKRGWQEGVRILDMGCGSGVIGLSLAAALVGRDVQVVMADVSKEALTLARENAERLAEALEGSDVRFVESDLFKGLEDRFDLLVANLPYVPDEEMPGLAPEVRRDPEVALRGGARGTEIMERFLRESKAHANPGAVVAMEFGEGQGASLMNAARSAGWQSVETHRDLEGLERFLTGEWPRD